jgi:cystathionine beta-synthase
MNRQANLSLLGAMTSKPLLGVIARSRKSESEQEYVVMMKGAVANVIEAVGNTPIVKLNKVAKGLAADIYVKLEYLNPAGSMKDRIAINIVNDAEKRGVLKPGGTIVEATSGNTGAGLAMVAAVRGYQCIFVMPDKMSQEKIKGLTAYGAKVVVCPTAVEPEDPRSYYQVAKRLEREIPNAYRADQYYNPANPEAHYLSTGPEIWRQTGGEIDAFVAAAGTGGTVSGIGKYLKEKKPEVQLVGVDPIGSIYYDYFKTGAMIEPHSYKVEGFGEDFLPGTMNLKILDEIIRVNDAECFHMTRDLVRKEGLTCGGSAGAAVIGAIKYAKMRNKKENILVLLPDGYSKYLSKIFDDEWMRQHGFLDEQESSGTVADLLIEKGTTGAVISAKPEDRVRDIILKMKAHGISQLPVLSGNKILGLVSEVDLLSHMLEEHSPDDPITDLIKSGFSTVTPETQAALLRDLFAQGVKMVLVLDKQNVTGVITKIDLIDYLAKRVKR